LHGYVYMHHILVFVFVVTKCPPLTQLGVQDHRPMVLVRDGAKGVRSGLYFLAAKLYILVEGDLRGLVCPAPVDFAIGLQLTEDHAPLLIWAAVGDRDILGPYGVMRTFGMAGLCIGCRSSGQQEHKQT